MDLGAFSVSLSVADLGASKAFYETLGFDSAGSDASAGYLIMRNGATTIGLFQGMFEGNILTFNPGWDNNAEPTETFDDVRRIEAVLDDAGVTLGQRVAADAGSEGPAFIALTDPDGNAILIDQHR